jgi:hypothetical protein
MTAVHGATLLQRLQLLQDGCGAVGGRRWRLGAGRAIPLLPLRGLLQLLQLLHELLKARGLGRLGPLLHCTKSGRLRQL